MKHWGLIAVTLGFLSAGVSFAAELKEGAAICITKKDLVNYQLFAKQEAADFKQDLLDRASCYVSKDPAQVVQLKKESDMLKVQLVSGQQVWVEENDVTTPVAE